MNKPISPALHGAIDYSTALAVAAAPSLFGFPPQARALAYGLASGYTCISLLTDYPLGARPVISFPAHGLSEGLIGAALPFLPGLLGFAHHRAARNLCFGLAALTAVVAALTDWGSAGRLRPELDSQWAA